ncbi:MAG: hypothetical protein LBG78_07065, partial [Azoarcus sp.]|nr:hypothetical protein [Azoarcus sp.]
GRYTSGKGGGKQAGQGRGQSGTARGFRRTKPESAACRAHAGPGPAQDAALDMSKAGESKGRPFGRRDGGKASGQKGARRPRRG